MMMNFKVSENKTGTVFYTRREEATNKPYRVRFKSFQLGQFDNRHLMENLDQMHNNYNVFKNRRGSSKREKRSITTAERPPKIFKNMKERSKEGEELHQRLKSMRETRKSIFESIKKIKE